MTLIARLPQSTLQRCGGGGLIGAPAQALASGRCKNSSSSSSRRRTRGGELAASGAAAEDASAPAAPPPPPTQQQKPTKLMYATYKSAASGKLTTFGFRRNLERDFELGPVLGEGGFGVVRRAVERATGRAYAAKLLPKRFLAGRGLEPCYAARVLHEVDALAAVGNSLNASHLVAAYEDDRSVALVMELCSGGALLSRVRPGAWGERDAQRAALGILRALAHCHSAGVLVRDVKPDNFLFRDASPSSPLKMIDFGLAVTLPPLVMAAAEGEGGEAKGSMAAQAAEGEGGEAKGSAAAPAAAAAAAKVTDRAGTPHFCAPEVLRMSYGYPADVWSAGVITYLLLAGRFPWALDPQVVEDEQQRRGGDGGGGGDGDAAAGGLAVGGMAAGGSLANKDLFRAILRGDLDFDTPPFNTPAVSDDARDCVRRMLRRDSGARPSAGELLRHPWLLKAAEAEGGGGGGVAAGGAGDAPTSAASASAESDASASGAAAPPLDASLVQRLQRFGAYGRLRQLALRRVAHLALLEFEEEEDDEGEEEEEEGGAAAEGAGASRSKGKKSKGKGNKSKGGGVLARVVREFRSLPRGEDGRVSYAAVADALARYDLSDAERRMLVLQLDADRDGRVDLDEFCAAMADWGALSRGGGGGGNRSGSSSGSGSDGDGKETWDRWLRAVFDTLDRDRSGRISAEELEDALCRADYDGDGDGAAGGGKEEEEGGEGRGRRGGASVGGGAAADGGVEGSRLCDEGAVAQALREADVDGDGALSLAEFEALLQGGGGGDGALSLFPARLRRRPAAEGVGGGR